MNLRAFAVPAAIAIASPAVAAGYDVAVVAPAVAPPVSTEMPVATEDWTGFYAGGQLGFGALSLDSNSDAFDELEGDGFVYGLHAGYLRDLGRFILGGELDIDGSQVGIDDAGGIDVSSVARAKLRLGYDMGRIMPYVTAGASRLTLDSDDAATSNLLDDSYSGGFAGIGAAYALSDRFVLGAEVLRERFEDAPVEGFDTDTTSMTLRGSFRF